MEFSISEKFRLEIYWKRVTYERAGIAKLIGCYFTGPVIKDVEELNQEDTMLLDFGNQYRVFVANYYVAKLHWLGVRHSPNKIFIDNVTLENKYLNSVPKLNNDDYILIDTKDHEDDKHQYHLSYPAYLINSDGNIHNF